MLKRASKETPDIFTIGHSTRTLDDFIKILQFYGIKKVIDIRTIPRSRHNPQFNKEALPVHLKSARLGYIHLPGLGGLRHPLRDSVNTAWRNSSFRGFADYMQTEEFEKNLNDLIKKSKKGPVALMCAEAVPWRCHRSLIADALYVRRIKVSHIFSATNAKEHLLTPWAKKRGAHLTYPAQKDGKPDA